MSELKPPPAPGSITPADEMPFWPCKPPEPIFCNLCRKGFPTELALQIHIKTARATGERCWRVSQISDRRR